MPRAGILLVGFFVVFLIADTYAAPNALHLHDKDEEETTDHVPWLEQGIKTGDVSASGGVNGQHSLLTEKFRQDASEAWEDLKLASMKVANAAKRTSQLLEGGKRNGEDMMRLALEDEVEDAKVYLKKANAKMKAIMGRPSSKKVRGSAYAIAIASDSSQSTPSSIKEDRQADGEDYCDGCYQKTTPAQDKKSRSNDDEEISRKRKIRRSRGKRKQDDEQEEDMIHTDYDKELLPDLSDDDYKALFRSAPGPSDEETPSRRSSTRSDIVSILQAAKCDLTEVIQSSMDSLLDYLSKKINTGKNNSTDSMVIESEVDDSPPMAGSEKRSDNIFGMEDGKGKTPLPELDVFNPLGLAGMFLRNFDQKMITKLVSSIVDPNP